MIQISRWLFTTGIGIACTLIGLNSVAEPVYRVSYDPDTESVTVSECNSESNDNCRHRRERLQALKDRHQRDPTPGDTHGISLAKLLACRPGKTPQTATIEFELPSDQRVSAPGARIDDGTYRMSARPCRWRAQIVFGELTKFDIPLTKGNLRVAITQNVSPETADKLRRWVARGAHAITTLYGRFPVPSVQVLVHPVGPTDDPVPWGEVMRGGGDSVHLFVDETKHLDTLNANWVLTHELSHLIHPYGLGADAWLSEGIASYYQNVLRARAGMIDAALAWRKLDAGFRRGLKQWRAGETLKHDTRAMMRKRKYMRVYWSGAAITLIADVRLRRESRGAWSMDRVFAEITDCCLPSDHRWSARELLEKMGEISGSDIFENLYTEYVEGAAFPDLEASYRELGIRRADGRVVFSNNPGQRALRDAIMNGAGPAPAESRALGTYDDLVFGEAREDRDTALDQLGVSADTHLGGNSLQ